MSEKRIKDAFVFIELIKFGLGRSIVCTLTEEQDWPKVFETSLQHGVAAIAFDGISRCYKEKVDLSLDVNKV